MKLQGRKVTDYLVLFPKTRCEEDVDLFREVIYALLGFMMNLCLQSPFVSEVRHFFSLREILGQPKHLLLHRTVLIFTKRIEAQDSNTGGGDGEGWVDALSLCSTEG